MYSLEFKLLWKGTKGRIKGCFDKLKNTLERIYRNNAISTYYPKVHKVMAINL